MTEHTEPRTVRTVMVAALIVAAFAAVVGLVLSFGPQPVLPSQVESRIVQSMVAWGVVLVAAIVAVVARVVSIRAR